MRHEIIDVLTQDIQSIEGVASCTVTMTVDKHQRPLAKIQVIPTPQAHAGELRARITQVLGQYVIPYEIL